MPRYILSLFAICALLLPLGHISIAQAQNIPPTIAAPPEDDGYALREAPDDHIIGSATAPNTLIIYASVTCPHCSHWFSTEWDLIKSELIETGELRVVFREFITAPPKVAATGFTIANCTKADNYIDIIHHQMVNQANIIADLQAAKGLDAYSSTLALAGLSKSDIPNCFADQSHHLRLQTSMKRAHASGLRGVPAFILNGALYDGPVKADTLAQSFKAGISKP